MNETVRAAIAADLATLTRVVDAPVEPFDYGSDLSCDDDLTAYCDEVGGGSRLALAQALYRRVTTPRGSLLDDPDYGVDVPGFLNNGVTQRELAGLSGAVRNELVKDDRVDSAQVQVTLDSPKAMRVTILVTAVDPAIGTFSLTFAVKDGAAMLEEIR